MNAQPETPKGGRLGGIRLYLVGLALLVVAPLTALSIARVLELKADSRQATDREAIRLARQIAARVDERIHTADAMLLGLSAALPNRLVPSASLDSAFRAMLQASTGRYANAFVVDAEGSLVISATAPPPSMQGRGVLRDRNYFQAASGSRGVVVGEPIKSRMVSDSTWIVVLARGLYDADGTNRGVVGVSIRLDSLSDVVSAANLAGAPLVTVFDTSGVVVARSSDPARFVGGQHGQLMVPMRAGEVTVARARDEAGETRVTGVTHVSTAPWLVNVGLIESELNASARRQLVNELVIFAAVALVAVFLAYRLARAITVPLSRLADDARALMHGAVGHRAVVGGPQELTSLAVAFNQMADTVERRNAALADSERRYRLLFDSNPLPMWAWDADTRQLLAVNEAAIDKYGYDRDAFLRLEITDLLDTSEHARFSASRLPFSEARQGAGIWKHRTSNGTVIEMEVVTTSSRRLGRASWLSVGIDVTARRAAERALAASEEQLRQSQKMEAIGAFAGGIAHDFNNLLTGMLGYCDLALVGMEPRHQAYADIEEIRALALRGADLTRQILTVSRKQVVQPTYIDPNDVVRGLDRLLRRVIGEHITFEAALSPDVGAVFADTGQLEQVLLNLAANARDAMPAGGSLQLHTRVVGADELREQRLDVERPWIAITVRDTGTGMSHDVQARIFEPFFTTKERGKGTGLGLALAYAMMEQAGGAIRVESEPGVGSTFHLFLPRHANPGRRANGGDGDGALAHGSETILLAEDEASVRAVATAVLTARGYKVLAAADGESALAVARQYPDRIDLLLTDVVMPGMNGRELAEALERERTDLRVLFASGYTDDALLLQGIRTDEISFIQKPFTAAELTRRVRGLLDSAVRVGG